MVNLTPSEKNHGMINKVDKMNLGFEGGALSDPRFEKLSEIIEYDQTCLAILSQDDGFSNLRIGLHSPYNQDYWNLPLEKFLDALQFARKDLYKYRREDEPEIDLNKEETIATNLINYKILHSNPSRESRVQIYFKAELMAEILKENNQNFRLLIYPNPRMSHHINEIQWDILFQEFIQIINESKEALMKSQ